MAERDIRNSWVEAAYWIETGFLNRFVYGPILADALKTIYLRNVHACSHPEWGINTTEAEASLTIRWYDDRVTIVSQSFHWPVSLTPRGPRADTVPKWFPRCTRLLCANIVKTTHEPDQDPIT